MSYNIWRDLHDGAPVHQDITDAADYHWKIDEGTGSTEIVCDKTGTTGTIQGPTWVEDASWTNGWALQFDPTGNSGDGDWIEFTLDSNAFGGEEQMWVSVAFQDDAPTERGILASVVDTTNSDRWNLETGSWDNDGRIGWWMSGDNNITSGANTVSAGTKHHVIGVHDNINDYREIMLDDQSMNTTTPSGTVPGGEPTTFKMGRRGAGSRTLNGLIGEVMIGFTSLDDHEKTMLHDRHPFTA